MLTGKSKFLLFWIFVWFAFSPLAFAQTGDTYAGKQSVTGGGI